MNKIDFILKTIQEKHNNVLICRTFRQMAEILEVKEKELQGVRQNLNRIAEKKYVKKIERLSSQFIYLSFIFNKKRYKGIVHRSILKIN